MHIDQIITILETHGIKNFGVDYTHGIVVVFPSSATKRRSMVFCPCCGVLMEEVPREDMIKEWRCPGCTDRYVLWKYNVLTR